MATVRLTTTSATNPFQLQAAEGRERIRTDLLSDSLAALPSFVTLKSAARGPCQYFSRIHSVERQKAGNSLLIAVLLAILAGSYLALAGSTIGLTTVQYDEFTDLIIASELSRHPLRGHSYDGSQARLPMYVTAVAYRARRIFEPNLEVLQMLPSSRWFSIAMIILAIMGTYILGSRLFSAAVGIVASALFTFSPYVLHFGRDALTQGDAFTPAAMVFTLIAYEQFYRKRTTAWLAGFSLCLALTIAAKFFLVILIPIILTYQLILEARKRRGGRFPGATPARTDETRANPRPYILMTVGTGLVTLFALVIVRMQSGLSSESTLWMIMVAKGVWGAALVGIFASFFVALTNANLWRSRPAKSAIHWDLTMAWLAIIPLTFSIALALFPSHVFNPIILTTLLERLLTIGVSHSLVANALASAKLYTGLILFKLSLPLGIATCFALVWALWKSVRVKGFLLIAVTLFYYGLLLIVLPLQQPFWLMAVYPLILLALSAMIVQFVARRKSATWRLIVIGVFAFAGVWLIVGLIQVYPTFGYYGFELIGERWMGTESRGYRAVVVVTNDGSTEAIDWLRHNVSADSMVLSYLDDVHIIKHLESIQPFVFDFEQALSMKQGSDLREELASANYVVVPAINDSHFQTSVSDSAFIQMYGTEPVHQIIRGRGPYRMPLIQIYQRLSDTTKLP